MHSEVHRVYHRCRIYGSISGTGWPIQLKFASKFDQNLVKIWSTQELELPHPEAIHTENFMCFGSGSVELQMRENSIFFTPLKYILLCRTPRVLGPH